MSDSTLSTPLSAKTYTLFEPDSPPQTGITVPDGDLLLMSGESSDLLHAAGLLSSMKSGLHAFQLALKALQHQTQNVATLERRMTCKKEIGKLRENLDRLVKDQQQDIEKKGKDIRKKVEAAVTTSLKKQAHEQVKHEISSIVQEKVRQQIAIQVPASISKDVEFYEHQIQEVVISLANCEARRKNATIRSPASMEPLHQIIPNHNKGLKCDFPKDIPTLLRYNRQAIDTLLEYYALSPTEDLSHADLLNIFLRHIGVALYVAGARHETKSSTESKKPSWFISKIN